MLIVGFKEDKKTNKLSFLVQNWWPGRNQFVEMDLEYLEQCYAHLAYIKTPQTRVPDDLATHPGHFMRSAAFEMAALGFKTQ